MRLNGLWVVVELAARKLRHPHVDRYKSALVLGSLREDVWWIPGARRVFEHLSFSHFYEPPVPGGFLPLVWPGPRLKAEKFHRRAVAEHRAGRVASGFVQLGRVAHLVTDMCCPTHAHRAVHDTDPYEWWVEANTKKLLELDVPDVRDVGRASEAVQGMALFCKPFRADFTNHHAGRLLRRWGVLRRVDAREAGEQAKQLIPMAAAWTVSLFRLFLRDVGIEPRSTREHRDLRDRRRLGA
jgi:hypothetical protein